MNCTNCSAAITDESLGFCTECGETFGVVASETEEEAPEDYGDEGYGDEGYDDAPSDDEYLDDDAPPPSALEQVERLAATVLGPVGAVVRSVGDVFQSVLDDPRLRGLLPGGSLSVLGLGLVALAVLLSAVPFIAGIGKPASALVLVWALLVGVSEWHYLTEYEQPDGRPVPPFPEALRGLPREIFTPAVSRLFALLICAYALWTLGLGFVSLLWVLAAVLLGYEQGQRYFAQPLEDDEEPVAGARPGWVVAGVVLCSLALFLPWWREYTQAPIRSGMEQPLSPLTECVLLLLACSALRHKGLGGLHPLVLILSAVWLTMWTLLMMNPYYVGPWVYLPGLLILDASIGFHMMRMLRPARESMDEDEDEQASDVDYQA